MTYFDYLKAQFKDFALLIIMPISMYKTPNLAIGTALMILIGTFFMAFKNYKRKVAIDCWGTIKYKDCNCK